MYTLAPVGALTPRTGITCEKDGMEEAPGDQSERTMTFHSTNSFMTAGRKPVSAQPRQVSAPAYLPRLMRIGRSAGSYTARPSGRLAASMSPLLLVASTSLALPSSLASAGSASTFSLLLAATVGAPGSS